MPREDYDKERNKIEQKIAVRNEMKRSGDGNGAYKMEKELAREHGVHITKDQKESCEWKRQDRIKSAS